MFIITNIVSMSLQILFSVYDNKANTYAPPFVFKTNVEAIRYFTEISMNQQLPFHKYPADYTLYEIGMFNDQTASFTEKETKTPVISSLEAIHHYQAQMLATQQIMKSKASLTAEEIQEMSHDTNI